MRAPVEVICHNDFATYNLVFDGENVVGVIDWDFASPGPRLWDIAYLAYRIVPLSSGDRRTDSRTRNAAIAYNASSPLTAATPIRARSSQCFTTASSPSPPSATRPDFRR